MARIATVVLPTDPSVVAKRGGRWSCRWALLAQVLKNTTDLVVDGPNTPSTYGIGSVQWMRGSVVASRSWSQPTFPTIATRAEIGSRPSLLIPSWRVVTRVGTDGKVGPVGPSFGNAAAEAGVGAP